MRRTLDVQPFKSVDSLTSSIDGFNEVRTSKISGPGPTSCKGLSLFNLNLAGTEYTYIALKMQPWSFDTTSYLLLYLRERGNQIQELPDHIPLSPSHSQ